MTYHFGVQTPTVFVSDRSMFLSYYITNDAETGIVTIIAGSAGKEALAEQYATELVGNNIVGNLVTSYMRLEPFEGGYNIEQVSCFDCKGWIPGFIQNFAV